MEKYYPRHIFILHLFNFIVIYVDFCCMGTELRVMVPGKVRCVVSLMVGIIYSDLFCKGFYCLDHSC